MCIYIYIYIFISITCIELRDVYPHTIYYQQQVASAMSLSKASVSVDDGLARMWEADLRIRERMRFNDAKLLVWPKNKQGKEMVGQPSMQALAMNSHIMALMASWWCPTQSSPKTPSIQVVKSQDGPKFLKWLQQLSKLVLIHVEG